MKRGTRWVKVTLCPVGSGHAGKAQDAWIDSEEIVSVVDTPSGRRVLLRMDTEYLVEETLEQVMEMINICDIMGAVCETRGSPKVSEPGL